MELFGLVFLVVVLLLIGMGIAIGLVACFLAALLAGLGVISSSFIIGIRTGRPAAGIRAFLLQCGVLAGIPAGAACAWLAQAIFAAYGGGWLVLVYGALGGAVAGVIVALCLDFISRRFHSWAAGRFLPSRSKTPPVIEASISKITETSDDRQHVANPGDILGKRLPDSTAG